MIDSAGMRGLFGSVPLQMMQEQRTEFGQWQGEIWRVFLFAMLLFLIAEALLILPAKIPAASPGAASRRTPAGRDKGETMAAV